MISIRRAARTLAVGAVLALAAGCTVGTATSGTRPMAPSWPGSQFAGPLSRDGGAGIAVPSGKTYVDPDGFSIVFPSSWQVRPDFAGAQVVGVPPHAPSDFADNVNVVLDDTHDSTMTLKSYLDSSIRVGASAIRDFHLLSSSITGDMAILEFTGTVQRPLHFLASVRIKDGTAFTATFTATDDSFAAGEPIAREVLDSLRAT